MGRTYNVVDADGHVLEPPDLWLKYIDPKFRGEAPVVRPDDTGVDRFWIGGHMIPRTAGGIGRAGSIAVPGSKLNELTYLGGRKGGFDAHARIADMDLDGIDAVILYPTLGLFSGVLEDPALSAAVCRAYNRWVADFCSAYPDRMFASAMLPMQSVEHAVAELRFARDTLGLRGAFIRPNPYCGRLLSDPAYEPLWAEAQDLDMAIGVHEGTGGMKAVGVDRVRGHPAEHMVSHTMEMMLASLNIIWGGVCERYPRLRFAFLESSGGWAVPWLDRMDLHFAHKGIHDTDAITMNPSDYFRRQCWISFDPPELSVELAVKVLGANRILWATDYPHHNGFFPGAPAEIAKKLPPELHWPVLAQGAVEFFKL
jgi:predicted TIM-barrel fold metal-dependent hydrolase